MRISEICTRNVVHIGATASVREAAQTMRKNHVGALVVIDQPNGERIPIGVITDRDIVVSVVAPGVDPQALTVGDVMSRPPATCGEEQDIFDAIQTMRARGVRRLPVLNAMGGLAGMLSTDDIHGALSMHSGELSHALTHEHVHEMLARR
jgi:CBS domain-containing protein